MTYFYGIAPWNIGRLTLFQWQDYMEKIADIVKLFQPKEDKKGKGAGKSGKADLAAAASRRKVKLPRKGL